MLRLRHRTRRCATAFVAVLSLLFSQLALASYVCPGQADLGAMADMMDAGVPCDGMDPDQPVLCHQHSADAAKTFESVKLPAAAQPAVVQVLVLPLMPEPEVASAISWAATPEARPPPHAIFLSTLRLRV